MSTEKEIPFLIFLKTLYDVRPKKNANPKQTHHWRLKIDGLLSDKDIRKVEFYLHSTFVEPVQVRKKSPFEIEEDGFGNFQMRINVKILNRIIPLTYFIELFPQKHYYTQIHNSIWTVKAKELEKVLDIGGIPIQNFDNPNEESKAISNILEYVRRHGDRPIDPGMFYPKVYERVIQKIKKLEHNDSIPPPMMNNTDMDSGNIDEFNPNRHFQSIKQHRHGKPNAFDPAARIKPRNEEFESKKELKRRKNICDSGSDSDVDISHENPFGKNRKKNDNGSSALKLNEIKIEKSLKRPEIKQEPKQEPNISKLPTKPVVKIENKIQKPPKEPKLKIKIKENNPDLFSKLFDTPDLIVLNKAKVNMAKEKSDSNMSMSNDGLKRKVGPREMDHVSDESRLPKKILKFDNRPSVKESKHLTKSSKASETGNLKPLTSDSKKHKPPEKTMPLEQKKDKKSDHKNKKLNSSFYSKPLSSLSSSDSELGSMSSKSTSDNEINPDLFRRKKSPIDHSKVVVKQLFGDDNDPSDDDDQQEDIPDLFSVLKNSSKKPLAQPTKHRKEPSVKSDDEASSDNDVPQQHNHGNISHSQSPDNKPDDRHVSVKDRKGSNILSSVPKNVQEPNGQPSAIDVPLGQAITLKERRRLAKTLLKIKNKKFFARFQRLLLTSYENREKSVSFDPVTLRLDFHMGEVSDDLVRNIKSMVDEYMKDHN